MIDCKYKKPLEPNKGTMFFGFNKNIKKKIQIWGSYNLVSKT